MLIVNDSSTNATTPIRGRHAELRTIERHLGSVEGGSGSALVIEADSGMGRSRLFDEAIRHARRVGFAVGAGIAVPGGDAPRATSLFGQLCGSLEHSLREPSTRASAASHELTGAAQLEGLVDEVVARGPVMLCIDDAHHMTPSTSTEVRHLIQRLQDRPVVWLLTVRSGPRSAHLAELRNALSVHRATVISLDPLCEASVSELIADLTRARPSASLTKFAAGVGGCPSLLLSLVNGLIDERSLIVVDGVAELSAVRMPRCIALLLRDRLSSISRTAREAALVAAVLGRVISPEHVASMLDVIPTSILCAIDELVHTNLIREVGEHLEFQNEFVRQAVLESAPPSMRLALQRQAIGVLLAAGASALEPAEWLADHAPVGDRRAIDSVCAAAQAIARSDPAAAANLNRRAVDLMSHTDERRPSLLARTSLLLQRAGRADEGNDLLVELMRAPLPHHQAAEVRWAVAVMSDLPTDVRVRAGFDAAGLSDVTPEWRARHLCELTMNLLSSGRPDDAATLMAEAETAVADAGDTVSVQRLDVARAQLAFARGDFTAALRKADRSSASSGDHHRASVDPSAALLAADALLATDRYERAHRAALDGLARAQREGDLPATRRWQHLLARYQLLVGDIAEADALLERMATDTTRIVNETDVAVLVDRGRIAIRFGDNRRAATLARAAATTATAGSPEMRVHARWLLALHADFRGDVPEALSHLRLLDRGTPEHVLPVFMTDATDTPRLVRMALAGGDEGLARRAVALAEQRSQLNPSVVSLHASALHARALLIGDSDALGTAAELLSAGPRLLAFGAAVEDHAEALLAAGDSASAVDRYGHALRAYSEAGAAWDAGRVRQRLRDQGVRKRLSSPARPSHGWSSLTAAETAVVRLVADGLTNRVVAQRLFLSPHTVSMHLRHVFTKLAITSRGELTRLVVEQNIAA